VLAAGDTLSLFIDATGTRRCQRAPRSCGTPNSPTRKGIIMRKFHIDMLERIDRQEGRNDATGLNAFFSNQLEEIRPKLYEKKYPALKARTAVPIKNDIHPGAMSLTERGVDEVGEAEFVSDLGDDAPFVEVVKDQEDTYYMRMFALKYGWSIQEMRNSQFANASLDTRKAFACRRGIERFIDKQPAHRWHRRWSYALRSVHALGLGCAEHVRGRSRR
jgi:hypothetical protein